MSGRVGVAISTTGTRPRFLEKAEQSWDMAGLTPVTITDVERDGVSAVKNAGLAELMDAGCEHLFLADDDCGPLRRASWERYVTDPAVHLSLSWGEHRSLGNDGDGHSLWSHPRGVLLYFHRSVIERVGGYRTEYPGMHEHVDLSRRVHLAGLTTHRFMDIQQDPREFFWAADMPRPDETRRQFASRKNRQTTIRRTFADRRRATDLWESLDGDTSFVEYR